MPTYLVSSEQLIIYQSGKIIPLLEKERGARDGRGEVLH